MNIGLITSYDGKYGDLAAVTNGSKYRYSQQHGYAPLFGGLTVNPLWGQYHAVLEALPKFDWIWKTDTDLIILNQNIKLESILDRPEDLLIASDYNGINCGSLFFRNTPWCLDFLKRWTGSERRFKEWTCPDQSALAHMLPLEDHTKWAILPQRVCNSYLYEYYPEDPGAPLAKAGQYKPGDFCLHLPALPMHKRLSIFSAMLQEVTE